MAQKIEFIRSDSLEILAQDFNTFVETFASDARFIITPIGFIKEGDDYVLAVRLEASHKRTFAGLDEGATNALGAPRSVQ